MPPTRIRGRLTVFGGCSLVNRFFVGYNPIVDGGRCTLDWGVANQAQRTPKECFIVGTLST